MQAIPVKKVTCEVVPDWTEGVRVIHGKAHGKDAAKWRQRLRQFFTKKANQTAATKKRIYFRKPLLPNLYSLKGLQGSLRSVTQLNLDDFRAKQLPIMDGSRHRRYYTVAVDLPPSLARDGKHDSRSCVEDLETGQRWLEVQWSSTRRILFECIDNCSRQLPSKFMQYTVGLVRGAWMGDPCHTRYNRFKTAVKRAGLDGPWHAGSVLLGLRKGPWEGAAHFRTFQTVAQNSHASSRRPDLLFTSCYATIVNHFFQGVGVLGSGSASHMQEMRDLMPSIDIFHIKGSKEKQSR